MNYNIDWEKTVENIKYLMLGRTYKKNFSEVFGVDVRAVQKKISTSAKTELSIRELMILADYFECDIMDLIIIEGEKYNSPPSNWEDGWRKIEVEDKSCEDVIYTLDVLKKINEEYEIRNLSELLLYIPLIEEEVLRDAIRRCYGNLTYCSKDYVMQQLSFLYKSIPDCKAKREADEYRDKVLRVKGSPWNNLYEVTNVDDYYYKNIERYRSEGNSKLWSYEYDKEQIEKKRKEILGL